MNDSRNRGRPRVITRQKLRVIENALGLGATVKDACYVADVRESTYYDYVRKNPDFSESLKRLKQIPIVVANMRIIRAILDDEDSEKTLEYAWRLIEKYDG